MDMLDGCYHWADTSIGLFAFFKQENIFAIEFGTPVVQYADGGEQDSHMAIVTAPMGETFML